MFKIEDLKNNELFKELDDSVLKEFMKISQEGGDAIKEKYLSRVEESNDKLENVTKELEALKNKNSEDDADEKGGDEMNPEIKELIEKQSAALEALKGELEGIKSKGELTNTRSKVLARAKEEGRDLEKVKAYIDRLGENLTEDESLELFPVNADATQTDSSSLEGEDNDSEDFVETGNDVFNQLINGE